MLSGRIVVTGIMLAIFVAMVGMALTYPIATGLLPLVIGIPAVALCLAQLTIEIAAARRGEDGDGTAAERGAPADKSEQGEKIRREFWLFAWLFGFFAVVMLFGFNVGVPVLLFAFLRLNERESLPLSLGAALAGFAIMYGIFYELMELRVFNGFLLDSWLG